MKITHAQVWLIFSNLGITGDNDGRQARSLIRRSYHEDQGICIVVDDSDLQSLVEGKAEFFWLLLQKIEQLRFGNPKQLAPDRVDFYG
jgi:hypothetical protein